MNWNKIKEKVREHKTEIIIAGAGIAATVTVYTVMNHKVKCTVLCNKALLKQNDALQKEILRLIDLCNEKDEHFRRASSELLRKRSSMGGQYMAGLRDYLKSVAA